MCYTCFTVRMEVTMGCSEQGATTQSLLLELCNGRKYCKSQPVAFSRQEPFRGGLASPSSAEQPWPYVFGCLSKY